MGGIRNNVWGEVYPEVKVDDDFGIGFCSSLTVPVPAVVPTMTVVGVNKTSSSFCVGAFYVKVERWRSR